MGKNLSLQLTDEQQQHVDIMRVIARDFHDLPMVLKGGTALMLCYGLDRFSEDLDFDSPKKLNITGRVERILSQMTQHPVIKVVKNTDTVHRLKAHYRGLTGDRLLKIETSFRQTADTSQATLIDGIRTYSIVELIEQKLNALANRTTARDIYDVSFLTRTYPEAFTESSIQVLQAIVQDIDAVEQRFTEVFEADEILKFTSITEIVMQITDFLQAHP